MRNQQFQTNNYRNIPEAQKFNFGVNVNYQNGNVKLQGSNSYPSPNINFTHSKHSAVAPKNNMVKAISPQPNFAQNSISSNISTSGYDSRRLPSFAHADIQNQHKKQNMSRFQTLKKPALVQCVICQMTFTTQTFEQHLQIHKNRGRNVQAKPYQAPGDPNIRYVSSPQIRTGNNQSWRQDQYSFQKHNTQASKSNSFGSHSYEMSSRYLPPIEEAPIVTNGPVSFNNSFNKMSSNNNSFNHNSSKYLPLPSNHNSSNYHNSSHAQNSAIQYNINSIPQRNMSYQNQSSFMDNSFRDSDEMSRYRHMAGQANQQAGELSRFSNRSQNSSLSYMSRFSQQRSDNEIKARNFQKQSNSLDYGRSYRNEKNSTRNQIRVPYTPPEVILEQVDSGTFKRKNNQFKPSYIQNRVEEQNQSSNEDVVETLENISREKMIELSRSEKDYLFSKASSKRFPPEYSYEKQFPPQYSYSKQRDNNDEKSYNDDNNSKFQRENNSRFQQNNNKFQQENNSRYQQQNSSRFQRQNNSRFQQNTNNKFQPQNNSRFQRENNSRFTKDYKSLSSLGWQKDLSSNLYEPKRKNADSGKMIRGVQTSEKQLIKRMKDSRSTNSKITKSSRMKIPKNNLAVVDYLINETQK